MNALDWSLVALFMSGMIAMAYFVGRKQKSEQDYYLGGNKINHWAIGISTMATQCSTNSLLGAPAFVIAVGGLLWLQYELAVPLAMIGIMLFLLPFFRKQNVVSVYEYLEKRFGPYTRLVLSLVFQLFRAFSTGVTIYGISVVVQHLVGIPYLYAVLLLGVITIVYDFLGGMRAVIYSDVIQMVLLYTGIAICLVVAVGLVGGWAEVWEHFPDDKSRTLDFGNWGFSGNNAFSFWPMLLGGFFLYLSYYGCDQTQVQRELSSKDIESANWSLFINGVLRFPLVLTYCLVGVAIGAFIVKHPEFLNSITDASTGEINYNLAVPQFCLSYLPHGVIGIIMISLFAAAMSSLDSTINSLSATTMRDVVERFWTRKPLEGAASVWASRLMTAFWGILCVFFSFFVENISVSIIESINKVSSLANGPILGTFLLATLTRRAVDKGVVAGIACGFGANALMWAYFPGVSWLWWNPIGCGVTMLAGYLFSLPPFTLPGKARLTPEELDELVFDPDIRKQFHYKTNWKVWHGVLVGYFVLMLVVLYALQRSFM